MERRQYQRYVVPCVPVHIKPITLSSPQIIQGVMGNLSYSGLQIFCNQLLIDGDYRIQFTLPSSGRSAISARLCFAVPKDTVHGSFIAGFKFLELSLIEFTKIKVFCSVSALLKAVPNQ